MAFVLRKVRVEGRCFHKLFKLERHFPSVIYPGVAQLDGDRPGIHLLPQPSSATLVTFEPRFFGGYPSRLSQIRMDFDLPSSVAVSGIPWDRVLPPLFPRVKGTIGPYAWTPTELLIPVTEHTGAAQVK